MGWILEAIKENGALYDDQEELIIARAHLLPEPWNRTFCPRIFTRYIIEETLDAYGWDSSRRCAAYEKYTALIDEQNEFLKSGLHIQYFSQAMANLQYLQEVKFIKNTKRDLLGSEVDIGFVCALPGQALPNGFSFVCALPGRALPNRFSYGKFLRFCMTLRAANHGRKIPIQFPGLCLYPEYLFADGREGALCGSLLSVVESKGMITKIFEWFSRYHDIIWIENDGMRVGPSEIWYGTLSILF